MASVQRKARTLATIAIAVAFAAAACEPAPSPSPSPTVAPATPPPAEPTADARLGGTIYLLADRNLDHLDPQRIYDPADLAFLGSTLFRSLLTYRYSADPIEGTSLTPDLATDLGTPSDDGRTWQFTLREGVAFETGDPVTCADIRYGVSRTFATDRITGGPTYAIQYLDIPPNPITDAADPLSAFPSAYYGPYDGTGQDLFERAVECSPDNRTITFHLSRPVADFNYATTLGFSPVPIGRDAGDDYGRGDQFPAATGPYIVESNTKDADGSELVLVRNPSWDRATDPNRPAFPDRWVVEYGLESKVVDERLLAAEGDDAFALQYGQLQANGRAAVFEDAETPRPEFADRAVGGFAPFVHYLWIDVQRVPNVWVRQAMLVALNRLTLRNFHGGVFHGDFADGLVSPGIGLDYAPTGIWDSTFGEFVPEEGSPELAVRLLRESGGPPPALIFEAQDTPNNRRFANIVITSLARAGIEVTFAPLCQVASCPPADAEGDLGLGGWAADWPSASTVIPPLLTPRGGWDLSNVDDPVFNAGIESALATLDRAEQARKWQELNRYAVESAWVIPTFFTRSYALAGPRVGPIYRWPAYSSWPYAAMHLIP